MLEAESHLDQGLAARRRLLLLVLIFLLPDLTASQRCTEGQTWPSVRRGRWTQAGSGKHARGTPRTLTSPGGGPWAQQGLAGSITASPGGPCRCAAPGPGFRPPSFCLWLPWCRTPSQSSSREWWWRVWWSLETGAPLPGTLPHPGWWWRHSGSSGLCGG